MTRPKDDERQIVMTLRKCDIEILSRAARACGQTVNVYAHNIMEIHAAHLRSIYERDKRAGDLQIRGRPEVTSQVVLPRVPHMARSHGEARGAEDIESYYQGRVP